MLVGASLTLLQKPFTCGQNIHARETCSLIVFFFLWIKTFFKMFHTFFIIKNYFFKNILTWNEYIWICNSHNNKCNIIFLIEAIGKDENISDHVCVRVFSFLFFFFKASIPLVFSVCENGLKK